MKREIMEEVLNTVIFTSLYQDFNSDGNWHWQEAYFRLLSWKNTWGVPIYMDINTASNHEAYLCLVVKEKDAEFVKDMLEDLGYGNIKEHHGKTLKLGVEYDYKTEDFDEVIAELW